MSSVAKLFATTMNSMLLDAASVWLPVVPVMSRVAPTARALASRIQEVLANPGMRTRAADIGKSVRAEDGVARAITAIEARFG